MRTINKEDIKNALKDGRAEIIENCGLMCRIGAVSFYFWGSEGDNLSLDSFSKSYTPDGRAELISDVIHTEITAELNGIGADDWDYMYGYLNNSFKILVSPSEYEVIRLALKDYIYHLMENNFESALEMAQGLYDRIFSKK